MPKIPSEIQAEHIQKAISAINAGVEHDFGDSRDYDLLHQDKRYAPKAVIGIAAEFATGERLHHSKFSSGIGASQACRVLHDLGFQIVGKQSDRDVFAEPLFVPGKVYRRRDIHADHGGQQQGGISTPKDHTIVLLITGDSGGQYGYADGYRDDGTYWYTGEGQVGDMQMIKGNAAILSHQTNGKTLHLFRDVGGGNLQCIGEAEYVDHHTEVAPDRDGNARQAIVFELSMLNETAGVASPSVAVKKVRERSGLWNAPLDKLRDAAIEVTPSTATTKERKTKVRQRSEAVRVYVLRRSGGDCEGCGNPAPFETANGKPYLEPHHTRRLADGGPDHPRWVSALCPNCHARVHYGADGDKFNAELIEKLGESEAE